MSSTRQRQRKIIQTLEARGGIIKVTEIASTFDVSNETARRDLEYLQEENLITRVYGGAILARPNEMNLYGHTRRNAGLAKKFSIGKAAAALVNDGDSLFMGTGSTMVQVAKQLKEKKDLTVITYSIPVAMELVNSPINLIILGGHFNGELDINGPMTLEAISHFYTDKAIIGASGVSIDIGISDLNPGGYGRSRKMSENSKSTILIAQSDKFGIKTLSIEMPLSSVDIIVTDEDLTNTYIEKIKEQSIDLILAPISL